MRMGLPQVIISDNGREFDNELDSALANLLGLERQLTTPYHPQVQLVNNTDFMQNLFFPNTGQWIGGALESNPARDASEVLPCKEAAMELLFGHMRVRI